MRVTIPDQVLFRELEGESVLLDLGSGLYFGLDEVGTRIWRHLVDGLAVDEVAARLAELYEADLETIAADVRRLVTELCDQGLLKAEGERSG